MSSQRWESHFELWFGWIGTIYIWAFYDGNSNFLFAKTMFLTSTKFVASFRQKKYKTNIPILTKLNKTYDNIEVKT